MYEGIIKISTSKDKLVDEVRSEQAILEFLYSVGTRSLINFLSKRKTNVIWPKFDATVFVVLLLRCQYYEEKNLSHILQCHKGPPT